MDKISFIQRKKLLSLIALLSKYELFHVTTSDGVQFKASELEEHFGFLKFHRWFATPIHSRNIISDVRAISPHEFICTTKDLKEYRITTLQEKQKANALPFADFEIKSIFDFINTKFIDKSLVKYQDDLGMLMLPISPYQLGVLTFTQHFKVKNVIDTELFGNSSSLQFNRTICFYCRESDTYRQVYAGIYNLETNKPVTARFIYDNRLNPRQSENVLKRIDEVFEFCRDFMIF